MIAKQYLDSIFELCFDVNDAKSLDIVHFSLVLSICVDVCFIYHFVLLFCGH